VLQQEGAWSVAKELSGSHERFLNKRSGHQRKKIVVVTELVSGGLKPSVGYWSGQKTLPGGGWQVHLPVAAVKWRSAADLQEGFCRIREKKWGKRCSKTQTSLDRGGSWLF